MNADLQRTGSVTPVQAPEGKSPAVVEMVPLPRHGTNALAVLVLAGLAGLGYALAVNPNIEWRAVGHYLTQDSILRGVSLTLQLTVLSMVIGTVFGIVLALMRMSTNYVLRSISSLYLWFFRGTPQLIQLIFWFNLAFLFPRLGIGPFSLDTNVVITPYLAALIGLSMNETAYMAEIVRAGLMGVDRGQTEAAKALGLTPWQTLYRVVLPQAMRMIIPPTGNQAIAMLKVTSLVSVIAARDLLRSAQIIYAKNYLIIELLIVASIWYLAMTTLATAGQHLIERHYAKGAHPTRGAGGGPGRFLKQMFGRTPRS